ncbi:MAG TPA: TIGR02679 family protein [Polyangiales bacterium]|nr:TIGR02679 family protein [Polyangiales bacterium]
MTPPTYDRERLERLLGGESLAGFRSRLRARFERGSSASVLTLTRLATHERESLTGLLGLRSRDASSLRVNRLELDEALARAGLANNLRHALELLDGPISDRLAERDQLERAWNQALATPTHPRLRALLERNAARGLVKRLSSGDPSKALELLRTVECVLAALPARGQPRSQLAADTTGDAHALDARRPLATIILACLREQEDERPRETWASVGVLVNELAKPALALNLSAEPTSAAGALAETARALGEPIALSLRVLLRSQPAWRVSKCRVFVCENANLLAIAADRLGATCAPLVCTDGMPSASQRTLLRQLADQGAHLHYHGDFDWPGVRIGNFVTRSFGAVAWRFRAHDYRARGGRMLRGVPVPADWDDGLMQAMIAGGYAVDEEAVASELLDDLSSAGAQHQ